MRYIGLLVLIFAAGLSYQNCHNQSFVQQDSENQKKQPGETTGSWSAVRFSSETSDSWFEVDPNTGEIYPVDADGEPLENASGQRHCLTDEQKNQLNTLLLEASVCEPIEPTDPNAMCTMIYMFPYAQLIDGSSEDLSPLVLGESQNGCMKPRDLCDPDKALGLRTALFEVRQKYPSQRCD